MVAEPQLEHRVSRPENDRDAIYELITDIRATQQEHSERLDGIDGRLDGIQTTLTEVVRRLPDPS